MCVDIAICQKHGDDDDDDDDDDDAGDDDRDDDDDDDEDDDDEDNDEDDDHDDNGDDDKTMTSMTTRRRRCISPQTLQSFSSVDMATTAVHGGAIPTDQAGEVWTRWAAREEDTNQVFFTTRHKESTTKTVSTKHNYSPHKKYVKQPFF